MYRRITSTSRDNHARNQYSDFEQSQRLRLYSSHSSPNLKLSPRSSDDSLAWSETSSDSNAPLTPDTDVQEEKRTQIKALPHTEVDVTQTNRQRASTKLLTQDAEHVRKLVGDSKSGTQLIQKYCCGGGCCYLNAEPPSAPTNPLEAIELPDNDAFRGLDLKLRPLSAKTELTNITSLPPVTVSLEPSSESYPQHNADAQSPPSFVQPHPPYHIFSAPVHHARELTKPGAEKRTFHFDLDVTDYPEEGDVDFKVGGAIGICPPNCPENVNDIFDILGVPRFLRDKPVLLRTENGRWPTIWGGEQPRELLTTRRELLTWCSDIQSYPPTKQLLRLLAEYSTAPNEKKILTYLTSAQGQASFCDLRTGPHITLLQLLSAFPSSKPPLPELLSILSQLMPRFYSLSNDPHESSSRDGLAGRRLIEIAVTVHEMPNWRDGPRTGLGSGFLERIAHQFIAASESGQKPDLRIPMFRGLMANPLSKQFNVSSGPMMLIGAGVGMAPFRGFILNRLRNANCASKIWLVQGVRDSSVDELYSGERGKYEAQIKRVVESRRSRRLSSVQKAASEANLPALRAAAAHAGNGDAKGKWQITKSEVESHYVQDEVRQQADVLWDVINAVDGRVFVCGSSKGMGEGVEEALVDVAMQKAGLARDAAREFWEGKKSEGKYIVETW